MLEAWKEFVRGKKSRKDIQEFQRDLMSNIISLYNDLLLKTYRHGTYEAFNISDPKPRNIHKATVRDRLLHHAIYRILYPYFDKKFIYNSYSCRNMKGVHKALVQFKSYSYKASKNHRKNVWVLKCDIKKFFASIDHQILIHILDREIDDKDIVRLFAEIIRSFHSTEEGKGLPLGNLTSQLLVNIYMNVFDQFVKHKLKAKYYIRYADDFVVISHDQMYLNSMLPVMHEFLKSTLKLSMHPNKISISTVGSGVDFLGWIHFPDHRVLRTATKRRMFRGIEVQQGKEETIQSYIGLLSHGNGWKLQQKIRKYT